MTYKTDWKTHFIAAILFGGIMGLPATIAAQKPLILILSIIALGGFFSALMAIIELIMLRNYKYKREEIARARYVFCDGIASMGRRSGWMIMTELGLEFYSQDIILGQSEVLIPFNMIIGTEVNFNRLIVYTSNDAVRFVVGQAKEWQKQINSKI